MAAKKRPSKHLHSVTNQNETRSISPKLKMDAEGRQSTLNTKWLILAILLATFLAFLPALGAEFVNWDDDGYVLMNPMVKSLANFKAFFTEPVEGNYHPLTMISLALNYAISGFDAWSYHLVNVLIHLVNCLLVFRFTLLLTNRNIIIAFTTAILFGIHPMHVESVAWVSERKDVLYGLFFLAGLISYTKFVDTGSRKQYGLTILFLILSLLSKPAAVIFPMVLFCIDLLRKRKLNVGLFAEKIPFFVFALIMGYATLYVQKQAGAVAAEFYPVSTRILFAFYGIAMYFIKMVFPVNLAAFYPFPLTNETLSSEYYIAPFFSVVLAFLFFYSLKKYRVISFGILFYILNLLLVLQFWSVGSAIIADRYTYIPYIGLFFIVGWFIDKYVKSDFSKSLYVIVPICLILGLLTFRQSSTWIESSALWDHAIEVQPSARAYQLRATLFRKDKDYAQAIDYFNEAIRLNPYDYEAYSNRGMVYVDMTDANAAFDDFSRAILLKPDFPTAHDNLGALYALRGQYDSSLYHLNKAIQFDKSYYSAYRNRGLTYFKLNRLEEAVSDLKKYLEYEPTAAVTFNTLGICYQNLGKHEEAISAITKAIDLQPQPVFYLNRSYSYNALKNTAQARNDALFAMQNGVQIPTEYTALLNIQ